MLGRRPGRVGCHGDHAPVGEFSSTVFRKATSGLPNTAMPMSAAPRLGSDRRVYVLCDCHSGSLSNCDFPRRYPPRNASCAPTFSHWRNRVRTGRYRLPNAERYEAMYAERAYLPGPGRERECDSERCRVNVCAAKQAARRQSRGKLFSRWAVEPPSHRVTGSHVPGGDRNGQPRPTCG